MKPNKMFDTFDIALNTISNLIIIVLALCTLFVAILSLIIALKALKSNQLQFDANSQKSQEMFDANMTKAENLSQKIIDQIETLQKISNDQISIINNQLTTSKNILHEQISAGRPSILLDTYQSISIGSKGNRNQRWKRPFIHLSMTNNGSRPAIKCGAYFFLVYSDYSEVFMSHVDPTNLPYRVSSRFTFDPLIKDGSENDFYFVIKYYYSDNKMQIDYTNINQYQFDIKTHKLEELDSKNVKLNDTINSFWIRT